MKQKTLVITSLLLSFSLLIIFVMYQATLTHPQSNSYEEILHNPSYSISHTPLHVVTTTTMIYDLALILGGEHITCTGLMNTGIDPHLYQASAGDVTTLNNADVIIYNGLHLEGKLGTILGQLEKQGKFIICLEDGFDNSCLLIHEDSLLNTYDPHVWFDVTLWAQAATYVAQSLSQIDPDNATSYEERLQSYLSELATLEEYIHNRIEELPTNQRILITAHDAFQYFGNAYGFQVMGLQGISTDTETSTSQIIELADYIVAHEIKAIFVESSISTKNMEALQAAVNARGFQVEIGGELYSDSLGDATTGHNTYITTAKANIDTIVDGLQ